MAPCWPNDTAEWDCLLTSASLPIVKHDTHGITVDRIYRDGTYILLRVFILVYQIVKYKTCTSQQEILSKVVGKKCIVKIPKGIVGMFNFTVP